MPERAVKLYQCHGACAVACGGTHWTSYFALEAPSAGPHVLPLVHSGLPEHALLQQRGIDGRQQLRARIQHAPLVRACASTCPHQAIS